VGNLKNVNPKKNLRLPFSLVRFFWASKRNEQIGFGRTKEPTEGSSAKPNEQIKSGEIKS
jgi:hypothetical protein